MENPTLPLAKFGMTSTQYRLPAVPDELPNYAVLKSANDFNEYRYKKLTHRQRMFVDCYLENGFDGAAAALEARYTADAKEARRIAHGLLRTRVIDEAIHLGLCYFTEHKKYHFDPDVHLKRLHAMATALVDEDGVSDARAVKKYKKKIRTTGRGADRETVEDIEIEAYSAIDAIKMLFVLCDPARAAGGGKVPGAVPDGGAMEVGADVGRTVIFEIMPIASGEFIPAPAPPVRTIEHT